MALFQKAVIKKHLNNQDSGYIYNKWILFQNHFLNKDIQENIRNSKEEQYQEGFLRDLFVKILGYTLNPEINYNLTTEYKNIKDSKKADAAILLNNKEQKTVIAVIELKGTDTTDLGKIENQAFGYKNNQNNCRYVITSNFEKIRFYIDNAIEFIEFNLFTITEEQFQLLYLLLAYQNISKDIPKLLKEESVSNEETITKQLYKDYSDFKSAIYNNLITNNPQFDNLTIYKKTQKLLDRFLFIFFAEDRALLPVNFIFRINKEWQQLRAMRIAVSLYDRYKIYFNDLNIGAKVSLPAFNETMSSYKEEFQIFAYNGGLFQEDEILDNIIIDDEILFEHTQRLSNYDFESEVDVNILGHIFENSLNEIDEIKAEIEGQKVDKTKTKRKKDGVFYTPKYITKYIVENTIGKLCSEKKAEINLIEEEYNAEQKINKNQKAALIEKLDSYRNWLLKLKICDPACGSGAFLNEALNYLIAEHRYLDELKHKLLGGGFVLSEIEMSILENNIFGVDINEESVEIAKLSLWLRTARPNRKLNNLSNNIKCGNSLIDDPEIAGDKAFNWKKEFPQVFAGGGFDVVIGNPPYVRADTDDPEFLKQRKGIENSGQYVTLYEKWDLMVPFYEKSLNILKLNGLHGFIVSNSIATSKYAFKLQKWILETKNLLSIDYFDEIEVFKGVGVVPLITIIQNSNSNFTIQKYIHIKTLENIKDVSTNYSLKDDDKEIKVFKKEYSKNNLNINSINLGDICYISKGMVINADEKTDKGAFTKDDLISSTKDEIHNTEYVEGKDLSSYLIKQIKYLEYNTERVPNQLSRPTFRELYIGPKILRGGSTSAVYDKNTTLCNHSIVIFKKYIDLKNVNNNSIKNSISKNSIISREDLELLSDKFNLKYLLAIINSKYAYNFLNNIRRSSIKNFFYPDDFRNLPIPNIEIESQHPFIIKADIMLDKNKELQETTLKLIRSIKREFNLEELSTKLNTWYKLTYAEFIKELEKKKVKLTLSQKAEWEDYFKTEQQKATEIKTIIDQTDREIDQMVYKLYELTKEEIKIVEGA